MSTYAIADKTVDDGVAPSPGATGPATGAQRPVGLIRGVLADRVVVSTLLDPYLSLKALAGYSGLSVRKLHEHLRDPAHPLPCYRVGGKLLVRRSEFDTWIARYRQVGQADLSQRVDEVLRDLA